MCLERDTASGKWPIPCLNSVTTGGIFPESTGGFISTSKPRTVSLGLCCGFSAKPKSSFLLPGDSRSHNLFQVFPEFSFLDLSLQLSQSTQQRHCTTRMAQKLMDNIMASQVPKAVYGPHDGPSEKGDPGTTSQSNRWLWCSCKVNCPA